MDWQTIAPEFEADGFLRDLRIDAATTAEWRRVWVLSVAEDVEFSFSVDSQPASPPLTIEEVFSLREAHTVMASYWVEQITYNTHFFVVDEIEFDVDPREIAGAMEADRLARFMGRLSSVTRKPVRLTYENLPQAVIALFAPGALAVRWLPSGADG